MEMRRLHTFRRCLLCFLMFFVGTAAVEAQPLTKYSVRDGRMYIELSKKIGGAGLDSFIQQFDLRDLALRHFINTGNPDSLLLKGWKVEKNNSSRFVISKSLEAADGTMNIADKITFIEKWLGGMDNNASSGRAMAGYNRFREGSGFAVNDSVVHFLLRDYRDASKVLLAGSFTGWSAGAVPMKRTDSGWVASVALPPGKYRYKFIVDGFWSTDRNNLLEENDGEGNINSIFYKTNTVFKLNGYTDARAVYLAGSFNGWRPDKLKMQRTATGWTMPLYLPEGTHTYKFVVDGRWLSDPTNSEGLPDSYGAFNSVLRLGKPYLFRLDGFTTAKKVMVAGSFNDWRDFELELKRTADGWELPYVIGAGNYEYKFKVDGKWMGDPSSKTGTKSNSLLIIQPNYTFRLNGFAEAKTVYLAGDFSNWNPDAIPMKRVGDEWVGSVYLAPGKHRYKFLVDGKWIIDPGNKLWEQNEFDTGNSVIWK